MNTFIRELRSTIKNPNPDRRSKDWNKRPEVPAGTRFIFTGSSISGSGRDMGYGWEHHNSDLAKLIVANSDVVEPKTPREMAEVHIGWWNGDEVLRMLVKLGRIGPADFKAVGEIAEADENF